MTLKALIFDVDGTLAETEEAHRRAFNDTFAAAGLGWHWDHDTYLRLLKVTGGKERMRAWAAETGSGPREDIIPALHRAKSARYAEILAMGGLKPRPGILRLVEEGRAAGLRLAVATTTSPGNVEALTRAIWRKPAAEIFDVIAAGDEVARKKPDPAVYLLALRRLNLPATEALAFEDSRNGVLAARAAGLAVVAAPSLFTAGDDLSAADAVLPDLDSFRLS
jgi:HAD superfamily hydrolase (TIGR01509 family)